MSGEDFTHLAPLIATCTLSSLLPLAFLPLVPDEARGEGEEAKER